MAVPTETPDIPLGLTFDDVLLQPLESSVLPSQADTRTILTREIPALDERDSVCEVGERQPPGEAWPMRALRRVGRSHELAGGGAAQPPFPTKLLRARHEGETTA